MSTGNIAEDATHDVLCGAEFSFLTDDIFQDLPGVPGDFESEFTESMLLEPITDHDLLYATYPTGNPMPIPGMFDSILHSHSKHLASTNDMFPLQLDTPKMKFMSVAAPEYSISPKQQLENSTSTKKGLCRVPDCGRRIRSRGLCKSHGGGKLCGIEGCQKSAHNGKFCIGHGGGKQCSFETCANAAQSKGLCKAHGGGARCKYDGCNKSSQGRGFCRAHGGGKRCEAEGCQRGAQRGVFCATHGGFRSCKISDCTRTDRGGGLCEVHRKGKLCTMQGCKKLAKGQGFCTMHIRKKRTIDSIPSDALFQLAAF